MKISTFATSIGGRELERLCWRASRRWREQENCFGVRWQVLDWNTPAIEFYKGLGARFLDEWKTVSLDGDALVRVAEGSR